MENGMSGQNKIALTRGRSSRNRVIAAGLSILGLVLVVGLVVGLRLFHVGPFGIRPGDNVVLARSTLASGARLCVVAHRTQSLTEPFEVTLYRTEASGKVFTYSMGYEDSFWWNCSIRPSTIPSVLHIRALGSVAAVYDEHDRSLKFPDDYYHFGVQTGLYVASDYLPSVVTQKER
jgi:hypothetical protein